MSAGKYDFEEAINTFFIESREMLDTMEKSLLDIEKDISHAVEYIPSIFRAAHTIKGSAGMFGFNAISDFTHTVENLLDRMRNNEIEILPEMISLLLECHDHIQKLLNFFDADRNGKVNSELYGESDNLVNRMGIFLSDSGKKTAAAQNAGDKIKSDAGPDEIQVVNESWHISLRFGINAFKNGLDPQSFITYLGEIGKIIKIKTIQDGIPPLSKMDPENCYMGFEINFTGLTTKEKIEEVFQFLRDDCTIKILPPKSSLSEYIRLIEELPEKPMTIGEIFIQTGSLTRKELDDALLIQDTFAEKNEKKRIGEVMVEEQMIPKPVLDAALNKQKSSEEKSKSSMRIDTSKLDTLIDLVGELVISSSNLEQIGKKTGDAELSEAFSHMSRLINDIRENSMNLRMMQIGDSFKKFERVVRDISREKGKKVELILKGGEIELDKTIIEKVNDPIMHLVRNAVDHGIDSPEERSNKGKPATGKITLNAYHETGNVVIEISDDGSGLKKDKILSKAIEKGLVTKDQAAGMSDNDLFQIIFTPGFSTADKITEISGRGVGMDVVKRNIESLRGTVTIQSRENEGTIIKIYLPLTLAIIDGFLVKAGNMFCVIPLGMVLECMNISKEELKKNETGNYYNLRGEIIPFLRIRELFGIEGESPETENILIVGYGDHKAGFIVDSSFGELQTVVKSLGKIFRKIRWISGATILGDGDIGLILDIPVLIQYLHNTRKRKAS